MIHTEFPIFNWPMFWGKPPTNSYIARNSIEYEREREREREREII
jgi:hypothetical protein